MYVWLFLCIYRIFETEVLKLLSTDMPGIPVYILCIYRYIHICKIHTYFFIYMYIGMHLHT